MKELSIQEKAQLYDEAIKRANELLYVSDKESLQYKTIIHILPYLNEIDDEKIRKELLEHCRNLAKPYIQTGNKCPQIQSWITWLEKQGRLMKALQISNSKIGDLIEENYYLRENLKKQGDQKHIPKYKIGDSIYYNSFDKIKSMVVANVVTDSTDNPMYEDKEGNAVFEKDIIEQKPTDKVEPKFKVGDWIVYKDAVWKVCNISLLNYYELLKINNEVSTRLIKDVDENAHLWTIQDAKDGDVLFTSSTASHETFIFKSIDEKGNAKCYFTYDSEDGFREGKYHFIGKATDCKPATKEQHDLLFQKMHEAGYEWDSEKKELYIYLQ